MGGESDDHVRADKSAHVGDGDVRLADMHAVCSAEQGDIDMIVDDEAGGGVAGETAQQAALFEHFAAVHFLFAVLKNPDARAQKRGGDLFKGTAEREAAVGKGIDIRVGTCAGQDAGDVHENSLTMVMVGSFNLRSSARSEL